MPTCRSRNPMPFLFLLFFLCASRPAGGEEFGTPDILKANVAFWKKIYTEVSLTEGLLHDADHPLVIYERIHIGTMSGRQRNNYIRAEKAKVEAMLGRIAGQPESAWSREERAIAAMLAEQGGKEALEGAQERIRFQQGQKERFYEGLCRSGAYLDTIRSILARFNVPPKLAYLPHVESSFDAYANSKVGAAGLWQFMRGTGRLYLKIDYLVDERRDPIASTSAAAKLLIGNYRELQSWPLAITAYNHGLYGMKRAVATTGSRDIAVIIERHESRTFKFASKNFYGCFLAVCDIAEQPEKYFGEVRYTAPLKRHDIVLTHYVKPSVLSRHLGVDTRILAEMNPAIRPVVFLQDKLIPRDTDIHLPVTLSLAFADSALGAIPDSLKLQTPPRPEYYRVHRGDNLYAIAGRFGVSARDVALENGISRMNRIYAGQVLRIPATTARAPEPIASFVEDMRPEMGLVMQQSAAEAKPAAKKEPAPVSPVAAAQEALPDTLEEIVMARAEPAPEALDALKGKYQGQFDAEGYNLDVELSPVGNSASIYAAVDETIGHYGDWLGIPTWRIRQLNRMGNRSTIHIGQRLTIPGDAGGIERFVQKRLEYHMAIEEDFYSQYKVSEIRERIVGRGETLWDICSDDGEVPLWLLKKYNKHADLSRLAVGMQLWLPAVAEKTPEDIEQEKQEMGGGYPYYQQPIFSPSGPVKRVP